MNAGKFLQHLLREEAGVTAIEYALLGSLICVGILAAVASLGLNVRQMYEFVKDEVVEATRF